MCEALYDLFADELVEHEAKGRAEGKAEGKTEGEEHFASLTEKLLKDFRTEDLLRATKDREFREELYREYSIERA